MQAEKDGKMQATAYILFQGLKMRWSARSDSLVPRRFEIKHDPTVGFYLYVFENEECIFDYLQDTFDLAIENALEDFGVPASAWSKEAEK